MATARNAEPPVDVPDMAVEELRVEARRLSGRSTPRVSPLVTRRLDRTPQLRRTSAPGTCRITSWWRTMIVKYSAGPRFSRVRPLRLPGCRGGQRVRRRARARPRRRPVLATQLVSRAEESGIWTVQAGIFPEDTASVALHRACSFRTVGIRERLGKYHGVWRDVLLLERRSGSIM